MATKEQMQEEQSAYGLAFEEPEEEVKAMSEDEAFGLEPEEVPAETSEGEDPAVAVVIEAEAAPAEDPVATEEETVADPGIDIEKERQRLKSWEGRLKAQQAAIDANSRTAAAEVPVEDGGEEVVEMAEGGDVTLEQAIASLSQDFGSEFVDMIKAIARSEAGNAAGEAVDEVGKTVEAIIANMNDTKQRDHFEKIYDAHPDFMEVSESPEFASWLSQNPDAAATVENGSARDVNAMLSEFKNASKAAADPASEMPDTGDAEGVRSTGMRLPEAPQQANDFKDAWDQF